MNTHDHTPDDVWGHRRWTHSLYRRIVPCLIVALLLQPLSIPLVAFAADDTAAASLEAKLDQKGTIILRDATLVEWLFAIQKEWGIDIVVGNELQKEIVNGAFTDTTLREVLTSILVSRGFGYRQVGKSLLIIRLDDMTIKPDQRTVLLPLELLNPQEVEPSVRLLLSQTGQVQTIQSSRSLFIIDTPEVIERVRRLLDELEANARRSQQRDQQNSRQPGLASPGAPGASGIEGGLTTGTGILEVEEHIEIFQPQYVTAAALGEAIQSLVLDSRVTVNVEENKVIVAASPQGIETAKRLIARLDVPRKQVRITAYMYDVNVKVLEKLGFNWSQAGKGRIDGSGDPQSLLSLNNNTFQGAAPVATTPAATGTTGTTPATGAATTAAASTLGGLVTLSSLSRHFDLTAVIQALEQTDGARLLARPNIMAYDRTEAKFESVQEIPIQQLTQTQQGGQIGTTQFRKAGITLTVTPNIMDDDSVVLQVTPAFSVLNGFQNGQPIIDSRTATTRLKLQNGEVSVIGGLVRRNELETTMGVPGVMNWKYLGVFFRGHNTTVTESELVVFIRAEVVESGFQGDARDMMAQATVNDLLEQIPFASPAPVIAACHDPYCPYHNPRPRYSGDLTNIQPVYDYDHYHPTPVSPTQDAQGLPESGSQAPAAPVLNERIPAVPVIESRNIHLPPPVIIDEMAFRYRQQRSNVARLPDVSDERPRQADLTPVVVRSFRQAAAPASDGSYRTANSRMQALPPTTGSVRK
ncbi:MAG: secretin N-terminal domain-containing protein [Planctomycetota bacterium]